MEDKNTKSNAEKTHLENDVSRGNLERTDSESIAEAKRKPLLHKVSRADISFWLFVFLAFLLGTVLRLYMVSDQILLGDEWHGMDYAIGNSFSYLFTHMGYGANIIPINLYCWLLLNTVGWSETLLRLPSIICGILSLVVLPVLVKKIFNRRVAIIFAFMLAISPSLIFYSRICRPYSMVALFGSLSIFSLYLWVTGGERKYAVLYFAAGVMAVYFHPFAAIAIFTPLGYVFALKLLQSSSGFPIKRTRIIPGWRSLTFAAFSIVLLLSLLLLPAFLRQTIASSMLKGPRMPFKSLLGVACLLSGTRNKLITTGFWALFGLGQVVVLRKKTLLGGICLSIVVIYLVVLKTVHHETMDVPVVISRFIISIFPLSFTLVAFGMEYILKYFQSVKPYKGFGYSDLLINLLPTVFLVVLFFGGPLIKVYAKPNNYTNHSVFREFNYPLPWEPAYTGDTGDITVRLVFKKGLPNFYQWLSGQPDKDSIIEYPVTFGADCNYYYQHFHKRRIIAGYITLLKLKDTKSKGYIIGDMLADEVLSRVSDTDKLKFRNMIDVMDLDSVIQSQARYIVLHKNLKDEIYMHTSAPNQDYLSVSYLNNACRKLFGLPVFENQNLIVFSIPTPPAHQ